MSAQTGPVVIVAHVPDLMDRSRLDALAGAEIHFVASPSQLARESREVGARVVVVDLSRPGVLDALAAGGITGRVLGFGSHVDGALLDAARAAGCDEVLPRSRFFGRLTDLIDS